jgi:hypothetical protein
MKRSKNRITVDLSLFQLECLISLLDSTIETINNGGKDPLKIGIDDYINLTYHLESCLDTIGENNDRATVA